MRLPKPSSFALWILSFNRSNIPVTIDISIWLKHFLILRIRWSLFELVEGKNFTFFMIHSIKSLNWTSITFFFFRIHGCCCNLIDFLTPPFSRKFFWKIHENLKVHRRTYWAAAPEPLISQCRNCILWKAINFSFLTSCMPNFYDKNSRCNTPVS